MYPHQMKGYTRVRWRGAEQHSVQVYQWWRSLCPLPLCRTVDCRVCGGSGMADSHNECGFCDAEVK